jgi:putative heme-binding domain-containing protein
MIATAPSGLMAYKSGAFGPAYRDNLFCAYFNTHKVQRHIVERDGATFRAKTEDFVWSTDPDFHPTDVLEDADGSLLVVDTGGWFRIGCPTSQIAKPQVLGGIYRVRRKEMPKVDDPRGLRADWDKPELLLNDPRWMVRDRALIESARRKPEDVSSSGTLNAVWALTRMEGPAARALTRRSLGAPDRGIRQAAVISAGLHRDAEALIRLEEIVRKDEPSLRREAATALGRIGDRKAVTSLLEAVRAGGDRFVEHAIIFALIRIGDRDGLLAALRDPSPAVRRAALIALDQMEGGNLSAEMVTPLLDPGDAALQQAALRVVTSHPGWSAEIFTLVRQWLGETSIEEVRQDLLKGVLVSFSRDAAMQDLMAQTLRDGKASGPMRLLILEAMARALPDRFPSTWLAEARWALDAGDDRVVRQAVAVLRAAGCGDFDEAMLRIARDEARAAELRVESAGAVAPRLAKLDAAVFKYLLGCMGKEMAPLLRLSAAEAVGKSPLDEPQLQQLAGTLGSSGPLELPRLIGVFERSRNASLGRKLLGAIEKSPGLQSIPAEVLRRVVQGYPEDVRAQADRLAKTLEVDTAQMKEKLDSLGSALEKGDSRAGREVFFGRKAGCTACHTVAGQGGKVGPDLSKIGSIRADRDLLEAIVFPSATFARGFEPFLVRTRDGAIYDGLIARETPDAIYLFTAERVEKRIARASVEAIQQSRLSIMPQGLDNQISREELRDLIAYLVSLK